jgi:uncharacterized OB-fold protein
MPYPGVRIPQSPGMEDGHHRKPIPDQNDPLTRPFWDAANERKLVVQQCQECDKFHHPPVGICRNCLSTNLSFREMSGRGHVYSFAVVHHQRIPAFDKLVPYVVASVSLDDAPEVTLSSNILATPVDEIRSGMPVIVEFEEIAPGIAIPQFRAPTAGRGRLRMNKSSAAKLLNSRR